MEVNNPSGVPEAEGGGEVMTDRELMQETIALCRAVLLENKTAQKQAPRTAAAQRSYEPIDLLGLAYALLARWKLILLCMILGAAAMIGYTRFLVTPQYLASSKLYVLNMGEQEMTSSTLNMGTQLKWDYQELLSVWEVRDRVIQRIGVGDGDEGLGGSVSIQAAEDSRIITISATSADPQRAMDISNTYAEVASEYLEEILSVDKPPIASRARLPQSPYNIRWKRNVLSGAMLGAVLIAGALSTAFLLDDKIRTPEDIQKAAGIPVMAVLTRDDTPGKKNRRNRRRDE